MIAITNVDSFYINISQTDGVNVNARKFTVDFGEIDGDILPLYWDKRPISKGRGLLELNYNDTTVDGGSPSSAAELKTQIQNLILNV